MVSILLVQFLIYRSSPPEKFCKKGVLRNFTKVTGKHLCQNLFFNNVAGPRNATLLKKRLWHRCFPVNFAKFLRTRFLTEYLRRLLLNLNFSKKLTKNCAINCCELLLILQCIILLKGQTHFDKNILGNAGGFLKYV